ncbi:hypothetical protein K8I61_03310 [bacterium]|nr:hypothetical protein [bacterium]
MRRSPARTVAAFAVASLVLGFLTAPAAAESPALRATATVLAEYDDNVRKVVNDREADFLARVFLDARLGLGLSDNNRVAASYALGAKKFLELDDEDTLINQLGIRLTNTSLGATYLGGEAIGKLRNVRDGQEDYNKLIGRAFVGHHFAPDVTGEIFAGYSRFDFRTYDFYDYWTQSVGAQTVKRFSRDIHLGLHYTLEDKHYPFFAYESFRSSTGDVFLREGDDLRQDTLHEVGFFLTSPRFILVTFGYDFQINDSNSYGDIYYNHRLRLTLSRSLTDDLNAHVFAIANFRDSYQEVLIPHSFSVEEDDENFNQAIAKLNYRIAEHLWLEARYGRFWSLYSVRQFNYTKNTYALGLTAGF